MLEAMGRKHLGPRRVAKPKAGAGTRQAMIDDITRRLNQVRSPFRTAEAFLIEEIIDPRDTRPLLCEFANLAAPLRQPGRTAYHLRP